MTTPLPWVLTGNKTIEATPVHGMIRVPYHAGSDHPLCYLEFPAATRRSSWRLDQFHYKGEILIRHPPKPGQRRGAVRMYVLLAYEPRPRKPRRKA